jgi:hypothetical protein
MGIGQKSPQTIDFLVRDQRHIGYFLENSDIDRVLRQWNNLVMSERFSGDAASAGRLLRRKSPGAHPFRR